MACSSSTPRLESQEIQTRLEILNGWSFADNCIEKTYRFKNFTQAMSFVNCVASLAEQIGHHPDIMIQYNQVTLRNWTHAVGGITEYDFELAEKIDSSY